ncbi:hypothetical protein Bache_2410 [Bacteroides helcogenes P 36-108]|uniref:Uncharacterized protein n=2 Tax=Bacteroides helcogenes TaxID=290053 RepID=E6SUA3_BACT6|nr:hypothetical protein Bache_2410 [Bacteroides helcogenes P 36-108]
MVVNLINNAYCFSSDMEDIRITEIREKLNVRMTVNGQEALSEIYYPDTGNAVTICDPSDIINEYFIHPELGGNDERISLPPIMVRLNFSDNQSSVDYTLYVFYSRYRVSFEPLTDFIFYSRYKIKYIRQNSIDYLSFFVSEKTRVFLDIIYLESGVSIKKTVRLSLPESNRMVAYNMSLVKISSLSDIHYEKIISYDARITNGALADLVRYVIDRQDHREMHQFLYYNVFGLPESVAFSGLVQHSPELEGDMADMMKRRRRYRPFFNDLRTVNTGYLDENKYKAVIDMLTSPVQCWYDTPSLPMEIYIKDIDFTHTRMGNQRVNVNFTFSPANRKHQVFNRYSFGGGIFDYTFDRTFE